MRNSCKTMPKYTKNPCTRQGSFGFLAPMAHTENWINWAYCRDSILRLNLFHKLTPTLYFCSGSSKNSEKVVKFISYIEDKLKLTKENRIDFTVFENNSYIIRLQNMDKFWAKNTLRRQFFTTLIRCGCNALYEKTYANTIKHHFHSTHKAAEKFLSGYTRLSRGRLNGWYDTFKNKKSLNLLVK